MFARGHNGRLESWPPRRKSRIRITPAKKSLRAKLQEALLRAVHAKFRRRRKAQKPKQQRQNRRCELFKRNPQRKPSRASWRPEGLRREIPPGLLVQAWRPAARAKA